MKGGKNKMKINVKTLTNALNKIGDLVSGDKTVPGVLLGVSNEDGNGTLKVAYSDGHKSFIEYLACVVEENDHIGDIVVDYDKFKRAIGNCQPSGNIMVDDVTFEYTVANEKNIVKLSAVQYMNIPDADGNIVGKRTMSEKKMDLLWEAPDANLKTSVLSRMKYDGIFEPDGTTDNYERVKMIDYMQRTSLEKGKNIYISAKAQCVFVSNQAHMTVIPVDGYDELSDDEKDAIRTSMVEAGNFTAEAYAKELVDKVSRVTQSIIIPQNIAKALAGILNKCSSDTVSIHRKDNKFCNIIVEGGDDSNAEKVGIWFEMPTASKLHLSTLERYSAYEYKTYQITFLREFLANNVKSAIEANGNDNTKIRFEATQLEDATCNLDLVIDAKNAGSSTSDVYKINPDDILDINGDLAEQQFTISLKVFNDMLSQLKTTLVALDFNVDASGVKCIRLAEVDEEKLGKEYIAARAKTKELCDQQGIAFDDSATPTPVELKLGYRNNTLVAKQYTTLANK